MDNNKLKTMDPFMLLSIVNMKLRDFYSNLDSYCDDIGIDKELLKERLLTVGYKYEEETNNFVSL
ncbi:DUF4250 domain-containing protein [Clostridium bornimense]|uniref:DUF4250 domain-containing protein n=1 Tax=Clostridium bornimense TaxID=1216932 RepID=UPI001C1178BD|nr:DUF4250 domain-containing protein [Clostridium bornimense]MBU5314664.1 DUF4250 domain-containing protein [Clostridium bornimense]